MQARAYKILVDYGFYVCPQRLRAFYIRNRVKYRKTYDCYRAEVRQQDALENDRCNFAVKMHAFVARDAPLIYFDVSVCGTANAARK